jgi:hypothetical protein
MTLCADTCSQEENDALSDETRTAQQKHKTDNQSNGSGSVKDGGHQFEMKMAAVIGLRGLRRGDNFELFSNREDAGNFDDLVYTAGGQRYFLQLKHADSPDKNKLTVTDLVKLLLPCLKSYFYIKDDDKFRDIPIENSHFFIYTNKGLTPTLLKHKRRQTELDIFFKTCETGEIFSFSPDNENKETDVYTLLEDSMIKSKKFPDSYDREKINEFLNKLIMVSGQEGRRELDKVIIEEIRKHNAAKVDNEVYKTELREFKTQVENWCRDKKEKMTATTFGNWLQEANTKACASVVRCLVERFTQSFVRTGIKFSESEISRLQTELSNKHAVHLRSDALTLCSILLLDCLQQSECILVTFETLQSDKNMLLHAWLGGHWECLIVLCDSTVQQSDISDTCHKIYNFIPSDHSSKTTIILTEFSVQQITDFAPVEHLFKFEQLSDGSQKIVLDKKIDFQGCEVTMRSVLQADSNVKHVLGPELVTDLITKETPVKIGGTLRVNEGYYAARELERNIFLKSNALENTNDVFAVSGTTREDLLKIVSSDKTVEYDCVAKIYKRDLTKYRGKIFLLPKEDEKNSFLAICKKFEGNILHWVEFKNRDLLWKQSRGSTDSLLEHIDTDKTRADKKTIEEWMKSGSCEVNEDSIWDLGVRTVLVVAEPGMGKSSTTTNVAWNTKLADPTSWVIRINWNDHTGKLEKINAETFNFDSLIEFLCRAAFPESKDTYIESSLLKHAIQNGGNVTVLTDGFDEICPNHAEKAVVILSELMKTKVGRIWVTSRPLEKDRLEKILSVFSFNMKKLSHESQEDMLRNLLKLETGEETVNLDRYLLGLNKSVYDENFTGCPLYIMMIATVCEADNKLQLNWDNYSYTKIDLINLYEEFVEIKLHIYITEKQNADITKSSVLDNLEDLKETLFNKLEKCALVAILPPNVLESLHDKNIEAEIQPFLAKVQAGKDKTGIVMNVVDGKPQFVHRTFEEYFAAQWFSRNFQCNRSVLERILFDPIYRVVRDMFNRMLAKDCPLHCAVLDNDTKCLTNLLVEGCNAAALDKGGRSFMHLIAAHDLLSWCNYYYTRRYYVSLDITDSVLQWTPLRYAIKLEKWHTVERLLERNVARSGLDMISQRSRDSDYIDSIILRAASSGFMQLLEFLCSIGVKISQSRVVRLFDPLRFDLEEEISLQDEKLAKISFLIQLGATCNTLYSDGQTPLFIAVTKGSLDVVRILVEKGGASVDVPDKDGRTVTEEAIRCLENARQSRSPDCKADVREKIVKYLDERMSETANECLGELRCISTHC